MSSPNHTTPSSGSSPQPSPQRSPGGRTRNTIRLPMERTADGRTVFPSISEDALEDYSGDDEVPLDTNNPSSASVRERLTSIARNLLSHGPGGSLDNVTPPTINLTSVSGTRVDELASHSSQKPFSSSPERMNVLQLSTNVSPGKLQSAMSDHSLSKQSTSSTPKRVSFDSSRPAGSPPPRPVHVQSDPPSPGSPADHASRGYERSRTRSTSPRHFWPIHRSRSREDPFVPVDPYQFQTPDEETFEKRREYFFLYVDLILRQIYLTLFFRLPSVYFSRVGRVFEYAELSKPEVQRMIELGGSAFLRDRDWNPNNVPPSLNRFKEAWEELVDTLLREWKTLNVVSALLLSAILTIFQTEGTNEPITRTAALISLLCALWSLVLGCIFILRFSTMRSMRKACRWAEAAEATTTSIAWNVWVFLSLPAVFLCWSLVTFVVSILAFVWTTGTSEPPSPISDKNAVGPRVIITFIFALGALYFFLAIWTFRSYSDPGVRHQAALAVVGAGLRGGRTTWISSPRLGGILDNLDADLERGFKLDGHGGEPGTSSDAGMGTGANGWGRGERGRGREEKEGGHQQKTYPERGRAPREGH